MLYVILVSGYKGSGKNHISKLLSEKIENSTVMSFAEPLKDIISITLGISHNELDTAKNKSEPIGATDYRTVLQQFGTEAMKKHFGEDVWVNLLISKLPKSGVVIISDWRFKSEYKGVKALDNVEVNYDHKPDNHPSEREIEDFMFDFRMDNTHKDSSIHSDIDYFMSMYGLWP